MNKVVIKAPVELIEILEKAHASISENTRNRILLAASELIIREGAVAHTFEHDDRSTKFKTDQIHRTDTFIKRHIACLPSQSVSFPIELFEEGMYGIFKYAKNAKNKSVVHGIFRDGEELGIWSFFECTDNKGQNSKKMKWHQPKRIVLLGSWWQSVTVSHAITVAKPIANWMEIESEEANKRRLQHAHDIIVKAHYDFAGKCTLPTEEQLRAKGKMLVESAEGYWTDPNERGISKQYAFGFKEGCLDIRRPARIFANQDFNRPVDYLVNKTDDGTEWSNRRYTSFSLSPTWIREEITLSGEKIVGIDACALHPNIIGMLAAKEGIHADILHGDSHQKISVMLGITRDEAKLVNLTYWNRRKDKFVNNLNPASAALLQRFHDVVSIEHPKVLSLLEGLNSKFKFVAEEAEDPVASHKRLSRVLFYHESVIIGEVLERLGAEGIAANQCYDCVYVAESSKARAVAVFNEVLAGHGVMTSAK